MKDGKMINDLHYTKDGYQTLGERFAESAIALIMGRGNREFVASICKVK
ncbi:MAG: hypothetical protein IZT59_12575 [Verrucomicrobia bacterium]|jgi:hypothetical protein|nr:hypothetical protein [Verrucomicrobiota bacterium]|tara:strand:+ start:4699 stop:4845 length:147 start_codon:yes stop_codon:yes gene_type:complete